MKTLNRQIQVQCLPNPNKKAEAMQLLMRTIDIVRNEDKNILTRRKDDNEKIS